MLQSLAHQDRRLAPAALWGGVALAAALGLVSSITRMNPMGLIVLVTAPLAVLVAINVEFGVYCLLSYASVVAFLIRILPPSHAGPVGVALDLLLVLMGLRLLLDVVRRRDWGVFKTPMTTPIVIFAIFQIVEVFNPADPTLMFGVMGLRETLRILGFFLAIYYFRKASSIRRFMGVWLVTMFAVGAYGIFQHVHGLLWQEMNWLMTEGNAKTHILHGYIRVFSTVGDAATFGQLMAMGSLSLFAMALTARGWRQWGLLAASLPMLYGMAVSYSRGCVVALAAGAVALAIASRSWKLGIGMVSVAVIGLALLVGTGSDKLLDRLQTATDPMQDASFQVRMGYIEEYLPDIMARPFGFGIDSSGTDSIKAAGADADAVEDHDRVMGVPTDNYFFKVALEMGWVGLLLFTWVHLAALWTAYRAYRLCRSPVLKAVALGNYAVLVSLFVGGFSNNLHCQKPIAEYFWIAIGLSMVIGQLAARAGSPQQAGSPRVMGPALRLHGADVG